MGPGYHNKRGGSSGFGQKRKGFNRFGNKGQQRPRNMSSGPRASGMTGSVLGNFVLSSSDLDERSHFNEGKITVENLPEIVQHLKRKRSEHLDMMNNRERFSHGSLRSAGDNWGGQGPPGRASFDDGPSGFNPMGDRFAPERSLGHSSFQGGPSRNPSPKNAEDFHGLTPKAFPHLCTLCELPLHSLQGWDEHVAGNIHKKQRQALLNLFSSWKGSPGSMGPPPMHMGAPNTPHGNFRGKRGMQGQGQKQNNQGPGRVIHVVDFERKNDLKSQLIKLVKPFGKVTNVLIMDKKELAFLEMATPAQANAVASHFGMNPAKMYGNPVRVGLSQKYSQLKIDKQKGKMQPKEPQQGPKQQNKQGPKQQNKQGPKQQNKQGPKQQNKQGPKQQNKQGPKQQNKQGPKWQNKQAPAETKQQYANEGQKLQDSNEEKAQAPNEQPKEGSGHVVQICNLPKYGYSQQKVLSLAKNYGKVTKYILMRHQAFVEMERAEDAQAMIDACAKTPLKFQGRVLSVILSQKYKNLVLKMPPRAQREERKRIRNKRGAKKQKMNAGMAAMVTTEDTEDEEPELNDSCEPGEKEEAAAATLETSDLGIPDGEVDQNHETAHGSEGFVIDEVRNEAGKEIQRTEDMETDQPATDSAKTERELEPNQPTVPTGVDYIIPSAGFYCKACSLFYQDEDMAKVTHCNTQAHHQNVKKMLSKPNVNEKTE